MGKINTDVIIVGQGIAGSALALELLNRNIDFKIVDNASNISSSMIAAGIFHPFVFKRLTLSWRFQEFYDKMLLLYQSFESLLNNQFLHFLPLQKLINENDYTFWKQRMQLPELSTYFGQVNENPKLQGIYPVTAAVEVKSAGYLDIAGLITNFRKYLQEKNHFIEEQFLYTDLKINENRIQWKNVTAKKIFFCEGVKCQENPYFKFVEFYPVLGEILRIKTTKLDSNKIINKNCFILPKGNNEFLVGSTYHWEFDSTEPTEKGCLELFTKLQETIDHRPIILDIYAGIRPAIRDRRPVVGYHYQHPQLGILNGLGTRGVLLAPYFAGELAKTMEDNNYTLLPEVNPNRFIK